MKERLFLLLLFLFPNISQSEIALNDTQVKFEAEKIEQTQKIIYRIYNIGTEEVTLEFDIRCNAAGLELDTADCDTVLLPDKTCKVLITFRPLYEASHQCRVKVRDSTGDEDHFLILGSVKKQ